MTSNVYFVRDERGRVKIGYTTEPRDRLSHIQAENADRLRFIRIIDGGLATEAWLHRRFQERHITGEWFHFHPDMMTIVPPDEIIHRGSVKPTLRRTLRETLIEFDDFGLFGPSNKKLLVTALVASFWEDDVDAFLEWVRERTGVKVPSATQEDLVPNCEQGPRHRIHSPWSVTPPHREPMSRSAR